MTEPCIHGLTDPAWCSICRYGPPAPARRADIDDKTALTDWDWDREWDRLLGPEDGDDR